MGEHKNVWLRAIDEALVAAHLGIASGSDDYDTAKRKINALIDWHVAVALDPAVNGGRQLVTVEPTPEMLAAVSWPKCATVDYRHMLAAAPTPPVHDENTSQERVRSTPENEHEPVAWRYWNEKSDSWNTTTSAPVADAMRDGGRSVEPLYLRSPALRVPEPMTDNELVEIYRALPKNGPIVRDGSTTIRLGRAIEAEVLRRVKEASK